MSQSTARARRAQASSRRPKATPAQPVPAATKTREKPSPNARGGDLRSREPEASEPVDDEFGDDRPFSRVRFAITPWKEAIPVVAFDAWGRAVDESHSVDIAARVSGKSVAALRALWSRCFGSIAEDCDQAPLTGQEKIQMAENPVAVVDRPRLRRFVSLESREQRAVAPGLDAVAWEGTASGESGIDWDDFERAAEVDRTRAEMERDDMASLARQLIEQADTLDDEWPLVLPETNANGMRVKLLTTQLRDAAHALLSLSAASETGVAA